MGNPLYKQWQTTVTLRGRDLERVKAYAKSHKIPVSTAIKVLCVQGLNLEMVEKAAKDCSRGKLSFEMFLELVSSH